MRTVRIARDSLILSHAPPNNALQTDVSDVTPCDSGFSAAWSGRRASLPCR